MFVRSKKSWLQIPGTQRGKLQRWVFKRSQKIGLFWMGVVKAQDQDTLEQNLFFGCKPKACRILAPTRRPALKVWKVLTTEHQSGP